MHVVVQTERTGSSSLEEAATVDVLRAADRSGGDVLLTHPEDDQSTAETLTERAGLEEPRLESAVGGSPSARLGNVVTHLLEREDASAVGVFDPATALLERTHVDGVAMALRRHEVVLGPALGGGWYSCGFTEPVDFTDVLAERPLVTLTDRGTAAGRSVDHAPILPTVATDTGRETTRAIVESRSMAGRSVPAATAKHLAE